MAAKFDMFNFLEEYQKYPCLWKKYCADYSNRDSRERALELLLPASGLSSIKDLKSKIRSIRCTYNQELNKIKRSMGTGSSAKGVYVPKLARFATADSFLRQNREENESESNLETLEENTGKSVTINEEINKDIEETEELVENNMEIQRTPVVAIHSKSRKRARTQGKNVMDSLDNAVKVLKEVASRPPPAANNEFVIFGQHVASQLESLPLLEALTLQEDIQKLITAARLRHLRQSSMPNHTPHTRSSIQTFDYNLESAVNTLFSLTESSTFSPPGSIHDTNQLTNYFQNWTKDDGVK